MRILQSRNAHLSSGIVILSIISFLVYYIAGNTGTLTVPRSFSRDSKAFNRIVQCNEIPEINFHVHAGATSGKMIVDTNTSVRIYCNHLGGDYPINISRAYQEKDTNELNTILDKAAVIHGSQSSAGVQRIALIIPFRDRESHLRIFVGHTFPVLCRQKNTFSIFVVEQIGNETFNKGRIMNSGFKYARDVGEQLNMPFDCFIFHDVDTLIENDDLLYRCSKGDIVDHLSTTVSKFDYNTMCCGMTVGGVLAMTADQYEKLNGFSNNFWGWGGEDDALYGRIRQKGLRIARPNPELGRFTMIEHGVDKLNPHNEGRLQALQKSTKEMDDDGLNSLDTTVEEVWMYPTFVKVRVDVGRPQ